MAIVATKDGALFLADSLRTGFALNQPLSLTFVGLFQGPTIPTVDSVLSDFSEVAYGGYARQPGFWLPASLYPDGSARIVLAHTSGGTPFLFKQTAAPNAVATGYFVIHSDAAHVVRLICAERFQKRVQFNGPTSTLSLLIPLGFLSAFSG